MGFKVYSPAEVKVIICAIPIEDGLAETFLKVSAREDAYTEQAGADGSVIRNATLNRLYDVELTLTAGSSHNVQLSALHAIDTSTSNGEGIGAFLCKDALGSTVLMGAKCWIKKAPDIEFGKEAGNRTWKITVVASPSTMISGGA